MRRVVFLHGVGGTGASMQPIAAALDLAVPAHFPDGPQPFDGGGSGRQWFSVSGITEANRPARVAAAMPAFQSLVGQFGDAKDSLLIGFSQGAIMALHAAAAGFAVAGVVALSGRLAGPVAAQKAWPPIHALHGSDDPVIGAGFANLTQNWLKDAGAEPHLQIFAGLGHGADQRSIAALREILVGFGS